MVYLVSVRTLQSIEVYYQQVFLTQLYGKNLVMYLHCYYTGNELCLQETMYWNDVKLTI